MPTNPPPRDLPPVGYPPDTVMTQRQLAVVLSCSVDTITRSGIRATSALGSQLPRYIWKHVIAFLELGIGSTEDLGYHRLGFRVSSGPWHRGRESH